MPTLPPRPVARAVLGLRRALQWAADGLVPPSLVVFEDAIGLGRTMALHAAVVLGLADQLADGPRSLEALAEAVGADPDALARLLRALATGGYFTRDKDGRWRNNRRSAALRRGAPGSLANFVDYMGSAANVHAWADFPATVRYGRNAFERVHGVSVWDWLAGHPAEGDAFAGAMVDLTDQIAPAIAAVYPFGTVRSVCDVACGRGALLAAILARYPDSHGLLYDAPEVLATAGPFLAERGVMDRVTLLPGSIFAAVPPGADVYLLKDVLHDWDDARSLTILRHCRAAMAPGATLLVVEIVVEADTTTPPGPWVDLHMMTVCAEGRQRSEAELARLFAAADLLLRHVAPTATPWSVVEVEPMPPPA
jgi:hypothetical protein